MIALRARRLAGLAAVLVASTTATSHADAEPSATEMRFVWSRGPEAASCAEASAIEADVTRRLGFDPFSPTARSAIECRVTRSDGVWTATIEELDETGARAGLRVVTSPAESCASLGAAVGLAVALIVRNRAANPPPAPPPPSAAPVCRPCAPAPPPKEKDETTRVGWFAGATAAVRVLPKPALGASLGGKLVVARAASVIASVAFLPSVKTSDELGEYSFGAAWGGLGACYDVEFGVDVRMSVCGTAALGALSVAVFDPSPVKPGARFLSGAIVGPRLTWSFARPAELVAGVDAFVPVSRSAFLVDDDGTTRTVFEQPAVGALFTLGVGFAR